jgi:hypothetical protein
VDTEFAPDKRPDVCPDPCNANAARLEIKSEPIQAMIKTLVRRHVAVTSTLPVWEEFVPSSPDAPPRVLEVLSETVRSTYPLDRQVRRASMAQGTNRAESRAFQTYALKLRKAMEFERELVRAGGLLMADRTSFSAATLLVSVISAASSC